jgi:hypothetical protein
VNDSWRLANVICQFAMAFVQPVIFGEAVQYLMTTQGVFIGEGTILWIVPAYVIYFSCVTYWHKTGGMDALVVCNAVALVSALVLTAVSPYPAERAFAVFWAGVAAIGLGLLRREARESRRAAS